MIRRPFAAIVAALSFAVPVAAQIPAAEYPARRAKLAESMPDGVLLVLGAQAPTADYLPFAQAPDFRYLTGILEPDAALVMVKDGGKVSSTVFVQPRDPAREVWEGARLGAMVAGQKTGATGRVYEELRPVLDSLLALGKPLQVSGALALDEARAVPSVDQQFVDALRGAHPDARVRDAAQLIARLRGTKSPAELTALRGAIDITVTAQKEAMRLIEPGMNEFEVQALIEYTFRRNGAERPGFATIVGSGPNSTALHYNANDRFMKDGDVVVMDIGALYDGYSADVTRTVPVNGKFSPAQRDIYRIVRAAQAAAEAEAKPGAPASAMNRAATQKLADGLAKIGLIDGPDATYDCDGMKCRQLSLFYMHGLGHGIGLEVHDPEQYYFTQTVAAGSAFTIEPGIYVRGNLLEILDDTPDNRALASRIGAAVKKYADIGVRIEDDYLVTDKGVEWVSRAPREIDEIEALMAEPWNGPARRNADLVAKYPGGG